MIIGLKVIILLIPVITLTDKLSYSCCSSLIMAIMAITQDNNNLLIMLPHRDVLIPIGLRTII